LYSFHFESQHAISTVSTETERKKKKITGESECREDVPFSWRLFFVPCCAVLAAGVDAVRHVPSDLNIVMPFTLTSCASMASVEMSGLGPPLRHHYLCCHLRPLRTHPRPPLLLNDWCIGSTTIFITTFGPSTPTLSLFS
jgi:hypothetical protein